MRKYVLVVFMMAQVACASVETLSSKPEEKGINAEFVRETPVAGNSTQTKDLGRFHCSDIIYSLQRLYNYNLNLDELRLSRSDNGDQFTIEQPSQSDFQGFSLNWIKESKDGFEMSVEWGTRNYYEQRFQFVCREKLYFLTEIQVEHFDKRSPDKWDKKTRKISPIVPLSAFVLSDFLPAE